MRFHLFCLLLAASVARAQAPDLVLRRAPGDIVIDGQIEPAWLTADSTGDFFQLEPYFDKPPRYRTVARVLATDQALYCLIVAYDSSAGIQHTKGVHDDGEGDFVSIMLDTFNDRRTAYKLGVTAGGVCTDARLLDDARNRDWSWDGVWYGAARIEEWGYAVEMKIPFAALRYDPTLTSWGLDFDRWVPARNEDLYWTRYERNEGLRVSRFGRLVFRDVHPNAAGINLEVYPVGIARATFVRQGVYHVEPQAGIDLFYNPSEALTFQLTGNPDFAQIEADPFEFNISRYETYFSERRPFFTEGGEIFMPAGRQQNTGFYTPLELFYPRRIGKVLPDGEFVPLLVGTKASGRAGGWEYGGFYALTGQQDYRDDSLQRTEPQAHFLSARVRTQILDNSSLGVLFVGKQSADRTSGVVDIDGAFRGSTGQLSYQLARSFRGATGDYAASAGYVSFGKSWVYLARTRLVGPDFDVSDVGFVPWQGTGQVTILTGPTWYFDAGSLKSILTYAGGTVRYEHADLYADRWLIAGLNMQFRSNWGYEVNYSYGRSRDEGATYANYELSVSSWFNVSPAWDANAWGGFSKTYNFSRGYPAPYGWLGAEVEWKASSILELGTSVNGYLEENPAGEVENVTVNARPYFSLTPVNDLNLRVYVDHLYDKSSDKLERVLWGFLVGYNFAPKSWIYLALNEDRDRRTEYAASGAALPQRLHTVNRVAVAKIKYLYYF